MFFGDSISHWPGAYQAGDVDRPVSSRIAPVSTPALGLQVQASVDLTFLCGSWILNSGPACVANTLLDKTRPPPFLSIAALELTPNILAIKNKQTGSVFHLAFKLQYAPESPIMLFKKLCLRLFFLDNE